MIPHVRQDTSEAAAIYLNRPFHVVIQNSTEKPLQIWRPWCSWGHDSVTLKLTDAQGKVFELTPNKSRVWTMNYPDPFQIPAGEFFVWTIDLLKDEWEGVPWERIQNHARWSLSATLTIPADAESRESNVWTGTCASPHLRFQAYMQPQTDN